MPDSRLPHHVLYGQLRLGYMSFGGQNKRFKDHIMSIHKNTTLHLTAWRLSHQAEIPGDLLVPFECHALALNTTELQLTDADTSMLH